MIRDKVGWAVVFGLVVLAAGAVWLGRGKPISHISKVEAHQTARPVPVSRPSLAGWSLAPTRRTAATRFMEHRWSSKGTRVTACSTGKVERKREWVADHWESCEDVNVSCLVTYPSGDEKTIETTVCVQKSGKDWAAAFSRPY